MLRLPPAGRIGSRTIAVGPRPDSGYAWLMSDRVTKPRRHRLEVRVTEARTRSSGEPADLEDATVTAFVPTQCHGRGAW